MSWRKRPSASSTRPHTAAPGDDDDLVFASQRTQTTTSTGTVDSWQDEEDAADSDVFAWLPPSTAEAGAETRPRTRSAGRTGTANTFRSLASVPEARESFALHRLSHSAREVAVSLPSTGSRDPRHEPSMLTLDSQRNTLESRGDSIKMSFDFDALDELDSPFVEVVACVSNRDDPNIPTLTIRMWLIGVFLSLVGSGTDYFSQVPTWRILMENYTGGNVFLNFRASAPSVTPLALLLVAYPLGKFLAFSLPTTTYRLPRWLGGIEWCLNPGPWNIKEHSLVFIMANVAITFPYALNAIVVADKFYGIQSAGSFGFGILLVLASQMTGFGLAGMTRRFLVRPASMVWPQNLVVCALLNTLHAEEDDASGGITRYRFLLYTMTGAFFFFFIPGYLFQALSTFSFVCWVFPKNVPVNQLFGTSGGLGLSFLTFDWSKIVWVSNPLVIPWWAEVQIFSAFSIFYVVICSILYYTNVWNSAYLPFFGSLSYDKFGQAYNVSRVLNAQGVFDAEALEQYSPLYLPVTFAMTYMLGFALATSVIVSCALYHGRSIWNGIKNKKVEEDDIHAKLMLIYPEVPDWWYAAIFITCFLLAVIAVEVWVDNVPGWILIIAVLLPVIYVLPAGFIYGMTGQAMGLNLLSQTLPGFILPGNPMANMVFKAYAVQTLYISLSFINDLKLGHYLKIPPRVTFLVQLVGTLIACFFQVGIKIAMFTRIKDICTPDQASFLTCPRAQTFYSASTVWGILGPTRQFGQGAVYNAHLYAMAVGAIIPFPFWIWHRQKGAPSWVKLVNVPLILMGVGQIPPATGINYTAWFAMAFFFQYYLRRNHFAWWSKFNYVTASALDSGTLLAILFIFFTLGITGTTAPKWAGNTIHTTTADWIRTSFKTIPPGGMPDIGSG